MKTLRLFISNDLNAPVNWVMIADDNIAESGTSTFAELASFDDVHLEVYLSAASCSIFKTSVEGISTKRLTEELVLGLIEENLVDDIDEVKPIILRVEDDIAYVAIFNREYFDKLFGAINTLNKNIRFIQSFAYATLFQEKSWTVFLSKQQRFLRTSQYEYYSLDDNQPLPILLEDMLTDNKPKSLIIYADEQSGYNIKHFTQKFEIECIDATNQYEYGVPVWNFHKQKSTSFKLKLEGNSKNSLMRLLKSFKYLLIFLVGFWFLSIIMLGIDNLRLKSKIVENLKGIVTIDELNKNIMQNAGEKLNTMSHQRGLYSGKDAMPILAQFLEVVSIITPNDIKQISYERDEMQIFLGSNFSTSQFNSYDDILETKRIVATIEDYKGYAKRNKDSNKADNSLKQDDQPPADSAWVITLKTSLMHDSTRSK